MWMLFVLSHLCMNVDKQLKYDKFCRQRRDYKDNHALIRLLFMMYL